VLRTVSNNRSEIAEELQSQTQTLANLHHKTISTVIIENARTRRELLDLVSQKQKIDVKKRAATEYHILEGLRFDTMVERHEDIAAAHKQTFGWIFHDAKNPARVWNNFSHWLRDCDGLYWITGKAGSGKSTLMKYIYNNSRTKKMLLDWSQNDRLIMAGFFFWNSGSELQKSLTGLLRSLFYEVLCQCPELISLAFPELFKDLDQLFELTDFRLRINKWTLPDLMRALNHLVTQELFPAKYCFLIDGLDEFNGDHEEVARLLRSWTRSSPVKVCVSSRPLIAFENTFGDCPGLMLQHLTYNDIKYYVDTKLGEDRRFIDLKCEEPDLAPVLVEEIVLKASGVFLWVRLVVASLLNGLGNGDGIRDLQRRLELLPADLKELYKHIFLSLDKSYLQQTVRLFDIMLACQEPLSPLELAFAERDDEFVLRRNMRRPEMSASYAIYRRMGRRLKSRSMGFLEIQGPEIPREPISPRELANLGLEMVHSRILRCRVEYLHKTVRDFLAEPEIRQILETYREPSSHPDLCLFRLGLIQMKTWEWRQSLTTHNLVFESVVEKCLHHAWKLELDGKPISNTLMEELQRAAEIHTKSPLYVLQSWRLFELLQENRRSSHALGPGGWHPLLTACGMTPWEDSCRCPSTGLVRLLLHNGADINQTCRGQTVWERILDYFLRIGTPFEPWICVLNHSLAWGADPSVRLVHGAKPAYLALRDAFSEGGRHYDKLKNLPWSSNMNQLLDLIEEKVRERGGELFSAQAMRETFRPQNLVQNKRKRARKPHGRSRKRQRTDGIH
jgi:hypothetical protein